MVPLHGNRALSILVLVLRHYRALSIIFGIIIDTFSQLRTEYQEKKKHMEGVCFICGVDRLTLDTQGSGFDKHIRDEHNMWQYAFALIHIRSRTS